MSPSSTSQQSNRDLARKINDEARTNAHSPYAGKFVGIANGQVVVVADNWREVSRQLRKIEPNPMSCFCVEASADYDSIHEIWSAA
jgi:hypothetical protein